MDVRENVVVEVGELMEKNDLLNETLQEYKNTYKSTTYNNHKFYYLKLLF